MPAHQVLGHDEYQRIGVVGQVRELRRDSGCEAGQVAVPAVNYGAPPDNNWLQQATLADIVHEPGELGLHHGGK